MSGVGVGSTEMRSALVDTGQLQPLRLMLNDLKTKVGYVASYHICSYILMWTLQESGARKS